LPGGYRYTDGSFSNAGAAGYWWSASEYGAANAWRRLMLYGSESVDSFSGVKSRGFSVKCLQD
jgi:uncharacterized protein (TIGR02145 family)